MFKISNLTATIGDKQILSDISIDLHASDVLLITGHNGSGKSTLLHTIMGRPDIMATGSVNIVGKELLDIECHERARSGVFMFHQSPPTIDGINTMTMFNEINNLAEDKVSKRDLIDQVKTNFKQLNLPDDWAKRSFNSGASGGERKKNELALAEFFSITGRAIGGKVLLLDEPDSGLEQASRNRIINLITKNSDGGGVTLLVTHDRELQHKYRNNSIELENGRIIKR